MAGTTLFLDCRTGVSGDMLLAALMDLLDRREGTPGYGLQTLRDGLFRTGIKGFEVEPVKRVVGGTETAGVNIIETARQPLRTFADIRSILTAASLAAPVRERALNALEILAKAESQVHEVPLEDVHFHEIGAVDTVADMVGVALLVEAVGADEIVVSPIDLGSGFVTFSHGTLPVPAPAVALLAEPLPTLASDCGSERATPTGVALLRTIADRFGDEPDEALRFFGLGSGSRSTDENPTYVRAALYDHGNQARVHGSE